VRLLAVAHGTRSPVGQAQMRALVGRVARRRPDLAVRLAYADVQAPPVGQALRRPGRPAVVVPLLLASGYHVRVDLPAAVAGTGSVLSAPLGPDDVLVELLAGQVAAAGQADAVVLAAAGSSDPGACAQVAAVARCVGPRVAVGFAATATPRVGDVVARLRAEGAGRVVVAAYLLAEGHFFDGLRHCGADAVTAPLATLPGMAELVLRRYRAARDSVDPQPVAALHHGLHEP
jgi:sirohydrochlorin ferrochelatase